MLAVATFAVACTADIDVGSPSGQGDGDFYNGPQGDAGRAGNGDSGQADGAAQQGDGDQEPTQPNDGSVGSGDGDNMPGDGDGDGDNMTPLDSETGRLLGITHAHNQARARAPANPALPELTWSVEIAQVAQAYADKLASRCSGLAHSSSQERNGWGENLAWFGGGVPAGAAATTVKMWEDEVACYTYGPLHSGIGATCSQKCASSGGCGHYTQIVWRKTLRVGCGVADCTSGSYRGSFWVCNYDPPGNYLGQYPY